MKPMILVGQMTGNSNIFLIFSTFLLMLCPKSFSQSDNANLWIYQQVGFKIPMGIDATVEHQSRYNFSNSIIKTDFLELSLRKKVTDIFKIKVGCRPSVHQSNPGEFSKSMRLFFDFQAEKDWSDFQFEYRFRNQYQSKSKEDADDIELKSAIRNKISVSYKIYQSPFKPYVELDMVSPILIGESTHLESVRYGAGMDVILTKKWTGSVSFLMDSEFTDYREKTGILGLGISYKW